MDAGCVCVASTRAWSEDRRKAGKGALIFSHGQRSLTHKSRISYLRTTAQASSTMTKQPTAGDVLIYIPNIIGYLRVVLTLTSITLMICSPVHWIFAIACYVASFVGDMFDGMAARKFNQCSTFGGLIDMVTDRCSTAGLLCVLSREYSDGPRLVLVRRLSKFAAFVLTKRWNRRKSLCVLAIA